MTLAWRRVRETTCPWPTAAVDSRSRLPSHTGWMDEAQMKPAVCAAASLGAAPRPRVASWRADLADEDEVVDLEDHAHRLGGQIDGG